MNITDVRVRLVEDNTERLRSFCTITIDDDFVVRDIKIIEGTKGLFVAMPSRKVTDHCPKCRGKNHLRAKFCNECGYKLPPNRVKADESSDKLHVDIAHPINSECRASLQAAIIDAYQEEVNRVRPAAPPAEKVEEPAPVEAAEPTEPAEPAEPAAESDESEIIDLEAEKPEDDDEEHAFGEGIL